MQSSDVAHTVRGHAMWAGIAALLLIYFGFMGTLLVPDAIAAKIMYHAIRIGGIAMAITTIALLTGHPIGLATDAVSSLLIGAALGASGLIGLANHGGFPSMLNVVFGIMFVSSGWNAWGTYSSLRVLVGNAGGSGGYDSEFHDRYREAKAEPPGMSLASQLLNRDPEAEVEAPAVPHTEPVEVEERPRQEIEVEEVSSPEPAPQPEPDTKLTPQPEPDPEPQASEPPPEGFLASFAEPRKNKQDK